MARKEPAETTDDSTFFDPQIIDTDVSDELGTSFLAYSMSVIVARALPDVRDGLKPVHRRILWDMYEQGMLPSKGYSKCARAVGDTMSKYHPHGDMAIYEALVRMAQPWSLRLPLIDGHGNMGSLDDGPAASRYCLTGDTRIRLADGSTPRIDEVVNLPADSEAEADFLALDRYGQPVHVSKVFNSGVHPTIRVTTSMGYSIRGSENHPLLCLDEVTGVPGLTWKRLDEMQEGTLVALAPGVGAHSRRSSHAKIRLPALVGAGSGLVPAHGHPRRLGVISDSLVGHGYRFARVVKVEDCAPAMVYSVKVDSADHSFLAGPFVNHNTEARLAPAAISMVDEINEETVDFRPNYDNREREPIVLPSGFPNLLVNGSTGIAVGMATNMPPHNLVEVVNGLKAMLENPDITLDEMMKHIPGPDLPTSGIIYGMDGVREAYETGRGKFQVRAVASIEETSASKRRGIVVTSLPYNVGPEKVVARMRDLIQAKKLPGVAGVSDHSDRVKGMNLVIECRTGFNPSAVLEELYRLTPLEESFSVNNVTLVDRQPQTLGLLELCSYFLEHRLEVIRRRSEFRLRKAEARAHILEGILKALGAIDEVIAIVKSSKDSATARVKLMKRFDLTEVQAEAILELTIRRLTSLEVGKIKAELGELKIKIKDLKALLASPKAMRDLVGVELSAVAEAHGTPRKTRLISEIPAVGSVIDLEIPDDPCFITLTASGMVAKAPAEKGPKARAGFLSRVRSSNRSQLLVITDAGTALRAPALDIPELSAGLKAAKSGLRASDLVQVPPGESPVAVVSAEADTMLILMTRDGSVKRLLVSSMTGRPVQKIIGVKDGDALIGVAQLPADKADDSTVIAVTSDAQLIRFPAKTVRPQGPSGGGMAGMRLGEGAVVLGFGVALDEDAEKVNVFTVSDAHAGKFTPVADYPLKGRGGGGVRCQTFRKAETRLLAALVTEGAVTGVAADGSIVDAEFLQVKRDGPGAPVEGNPQQLYIR